MIKTHWVWWRHLSSRVYVTPESCRYFALSLPQHLHHVFHHRLQRRRSSGSCFAPSRSTSGHQPQEGEPGLRFGRRSGFTASSLLTVCVCVRVFDFTQYTQLFLQTWFCSMTPSTSKPPLFLERRSGEKNHRRRWSVVRQVGPPVPSGDAVYHRITDLLNVLIHQNKQWTRFFLASGRLLELVMNNDMCRLPQRHESCPNGAADVLKEPPYRRQTFHSYTFVSCWLDSTLIFFKLNVFFIFKSAIDLSVNVFAPCRRHIKSFMNDYALTVWDRSLACVLYFNHMLHWCDLKGNILVLNWINQLSVNCNMIVPLLSNNIYFCLILLFGCFSGVRVENPLFLHDTTDWR